MMKKKTQKIKQKGERRTKRKKKKRGKNKKGIFYIISQY